MKNFHVHEKIAFASSSRIRSVQNRLLREHLVYCAGQSPFYRRLFRRKKIDPGKITLSHLRDIPFTDKDDIGNDNDGFLAVKPQRIADIVLSSGTTGAQTKIAYTESDLKRLAYNEEKAFRACGFTARDVVLLTCTMDRCFVAGLAYFLGIRAVGAAAVRNGLNSLESHAEVIRRMNPTALVGVPGFLRKLGLFLVREKCLPKTVSKLVCIGEPLRGAALEPLKVARDLEDIWGARAYSTYSSSEIITTFCECPVQAGGHLHPDLAVLEIVGETGEVLGPGQTGEVVVTPLSVEGMPLVRFKTGDISFMIEQPCRCGRAAARLGPILGRKRQMMKVRGTTMYPQALYSVLDEIKGVGEYYITATSEGELSDSIEVCAAVCGAGCTPESIRDKLQARLRVRPRVRIEDERAVRDRVYDPKSRKPIRFFDRRVR